MSAHGRVSELLAPLHREDVRLLVPLFVDTFPLGHFYASMSSETTDLVRVFDWNDERGLIDLLAQAVKKETPMGVYLSGDMAKEIRESVRLYPQLNSFYDVRDIPVSTLRIRRFFARLESGEKVVSSEEEFVERCRDIDTIIVHSDTVNLAEAGRRYLAERVEKLSVNWPRPPKLVSKHSDLSLSLFCLPSYQRLRHVYWFSEVGQAALRKTTQNFAEFLVPDETYRDWDEFRLVLLLFLPASMHMNKQGEVITSFQNFHEHLFSLDKSSLNEIFDPVWKVFMLLFVATKWPIFNLFENVEEYTSCFVDHHTHIGRAKTQS